MGREFEVDPGYLLRRADAEPLLQARDSPRQTPQVDVIWVIGQRNVVRLSSCAGRLSGRSP